MPTHSQRSPKLTTALLERAYRQGVFPMGDPETGRVEWYLPDVRTLIDLEHFHVSRRLAKTLRSGRFRFSINEAFPEVIRRCGRWERPEEVWITREIVDLYCAMHTAGKAHSGEAWEGEALAGGLYGVALGGAFIGESMFHVARDASKACLVALVARLRERGFVLLDTQFPTEHLARFGIEIVPHEEYMRRLEHALQMREVRFGP